MKQRLNLITLGVADIDRARRFYTDIGWSPDLEPDGEVIFFQAGDMIVALWDRAKLAVDSTVENSPGWGGVTLAVCVEDRAAVDAVTEEARRAGAKIGREPAGTFWGGYSSVVIDPDGHPWEIAHNPGFTLTEDGGVRI